MLLNICNIFYHSSYLQIFLINSIKDQKANQTTLIEMLILFMTNYACIKNFRVNVEQMMMDINSSHLQRICKFDIGAIRYHDFNKFSFKVEVLSNSQYTTSSKMLVNCTDSKIDLTFDTLDQIKNAQIDFIDTNIRNLFCNCIVKYLTIIMSSLNSLLVQKNVLLASSAMPLLQSNTLASLDYSAACYSGSK